MKNQKEKSLRGRMAEGAPNPVDVHVGNRIRLRRTLLGFSQQYMAQKLGLTFQQLQKYEKGFNRVGASRLYDISRVLGVSMNFFFEDMKENVQNLSPMMLNMDHKVVMHLAEESEGFEADPMKRRETIELVRGYYRISNRKMAKNIFDLIINLSKSGATTDE